MFNLSDIKDIDNFLAHKKEDKKETFSEHCRLTAKYRDKIIGSFGLDKIMDNLLKKIGVETDVKNIIYGIIEYHDMGKLSIEFQDKIKNNIKNRDASHSDKSYYLFVYKLMLLSKDKKINSKSFILLFLLLYAVYKHHGKLSNIINDISSFNNNYKKEKLVYLVKLVNLEYSEEIIKTMENEKFWSRWIDDYNSKRYLDELIANELYVFTLFKLVNSILISSDYYATNQFAMNMESEFEILTGSKIKEMDKLFKNWEFNQTIEDNKETLLNKKNKINGTKDLNDLRNIINVCSEESLNKLLEDNAKKVFFLNVPTGGGKTNLSLRLALAIMQKSMIKKVFYVFPFINIIEQSYNSLKKFTGEDNTARIDSKNIDLKEVEEDSNDKLVSNYIDNLFFNYPVLFLSHVRFFDMIFKNDKNANFNFYQLANSVIIIDEIQAYKDYMWTALANIFKICGEILNTHFIIMSATLPELNKLINKDDSFVKILEDDFNKKIFNHDCFNKRVIIKPQKDITKENFIKKVNTEKDKILIILNKVIDFYDLYESFKSNKQFIDYDILLLNSTIMDFKRKEIIDKCKEDNKRIILISTQSVEAGVDIDFDICYRAYSPLDSIVQAAGRVNRNAKKNYACEVIIFDDENWKNIYRGDYKSTVSKSKKDDLFKEKEINSISQMEAFYNDIIESIYNDNNTPFLKSPETSVKDMKLLRFKNINDELRLIDGDNISIFIPLEINVNNLKDEQQKIIAASLNDLVKENILSGADVWNKYESIIEERSDFTGSIKVKQFQKILTLFTVNIFNYYYEGGKVKDFLADKIKYGYYYMNDYKEYYNEDTGLDVKKFKDSLNISKALFI